MKLVFTFVDTDAQKHAQLTVADAKYMPSVQDTVVLLAARTAVSLKVTDREIHYWPEGEIEAVFLHAVKVIALHPPFQS